MRQLERPGADIDAKRFRKGREIAANAGVHMQPEAMFARDLVERVDRIDEAIGEAGRGADQHERVVVDGGGHPAWVGAVVLADVDARDFQAEGVRRLVEGGMGRPRRDNPASGPPLGACAVARRLHRHEDAFGAAAGHAARTFGGAEKIAGEADHLPLHPLQAWEGLGREPVFRHEHAIGFAADATHLVARVEDVDGGLQAAPVGVRRRVIAHLLLERVPGGAGLRQGDRRHPLILQSRFLGFVHTAGVSIDASSPDRKGSRHA